MTYEDLDLYQVESFLEQEEFQKKSQIFGLRPRPWTIFSQHIVPALNNWENKYHTFVKTFLKANLDN